MDDERLLNSQRFVIDWFIATWVTCRKADAGDVDKMLIIKEHWNGAQSGDASVTIHANEMTILAEKN